MEYIYFGRGDCSIGGKNVDGVGKGCGKGLGEESGVKGDMVIGVGNS